MTREEAINTMKSGYCVTGPTFALGIYIFINDCGRVENNLGSALGLGEFRFLGGEDWMDGWVICGTNQQCYFGGSKIIRKPILFNHYRTKSLKRSYDQR